jgi:hypothetical protein
VRAPPQRHSDAATISSRIRQPSAARKARVELRLAHLPLQSGEFHSRVVVGSSQSRVTRRDQYGTIRGMPESDPPDPWQQGPTLNADGRLEGRVARIEPEGAGPLPRPAEEPVLELAERAPKRPEPEHLGYRPPIPDVRRQRAVRLVLAAAIAGVVVLAAGLLVSRPAPRGRPSVDTVHESSVIDQLLGGGPKAPAIITSEPAGATVTIGGQKVGVTPWAGDNVWTGDTPIVIESPGYRPWKGTLRGGEEVHLNARLTK